MMEDRKGHHAPEGTGSALAGVLTPTGHRTWARVYFADTDFSGVVFHARYLEFFERGRSDFLRLVGVEHRELASGTGGEVLVWIVRRMDIVFHRPARIDDVLMVDTEAERISGARVFMLQRIFRDGTLLVEAKVELAMVGTDGRPRRLPKAWIGAFLPKGEGASGNGGA